MKKGFCLIFALLGLLFLTFSCGGNPAADGEAGRCLVRLDSLVEADADSALRLMGRMQSQGWPRRDAMRLELLRAMAMNRADSLFTTDSVMCRVAEYYRRHGSQNDRMLSLYLLGCTYRDMGAAPRAIETWQQAVAEADTARQDCDLSTLMRIHSQMSFLFRMQHLPEYEEQELEKAEALCWKMGDTLSAIAFEQASCNTLFNKRDYDNCIRRAQYLHERYLNWGLKDKSAKTVVFCLKSYLKLKDYAKAKHYLEIYESYCLSEKDHRKISGGLAPYYIYKGNYYLGIGNIDSAEYCFRQAMPEMHMLHNDVAVYWGLQNVYAAKHQADSTLKYVSSYALAKDDELGRLKIQATADAKNLYDYSVEQRIADGEREKVFKRTSEVHISFIIILSLLCIATYTWILKLRKDLRIRRERQRFMEVTQNLHEARTQLDYLYDAKKRLEDTEAEAMNRITNLETEKARLVQEHREEEEQYQKIGRELETQLSEERKEVERLREESVALQTTISAQEEELRQYQSERQEQERTLAMIPSMKRVQAVANSSVVARFHEVINRFPNGHPTVQDWADLQDLIESTYPSFNGRVNQNGVLEEKDYRLCLLVKAQFAIRDLDILMNWSRGYSSTVRRRLHKLIFGCEGGAAEFDRKISLIQ